ncbi:MAG: FHA domain-containing protein [Deltaproteobacteria bacterium]|nr:FHA domain-containing protein [Deltaproteobacteria bacterium]
MLAIHVARDDEHREVATDEDEVTVGRDPRNAVVLGDPSVSRRHCRLFERDGAWWVVDLGSERGTYVNGRRIAAATQLRETDRVHVGPCVLSIEIVPDTLDEPTTQRAGLSRTSVHTVPRPRPPTLDEQPTAPRPARTTEERPTTARPIAAVLDEQLTTARPSAARFDPAADEPPTTARPDADEQRTVARPSPVRRPGSSPPRARTCARCASQIPSSFVFCGTCGARVR